MVQTAKTGAAFSLKENTSIHLSDPSTSASRYNRYVNINKKHLARSLALEATIKPGVSLVSFWQDHQQPRPVTEQESLILRKALIASTELIDLGEFVE
jgi:hypothetical protein